MRGIKIDTHIGTHPHIGSDQLQCTVCTLIGDVINHLGIAQNVYIKGIAVTEIYHTLASFELVELFPVNLLNSKAVGALIYYLYTGRVMMQFNGIRRALIMFVPHHRVTV